jgi:hypothetical protein
MFDLDVEIDSFRGEVKKKEVCFNLGQILENKSLERKCSMDNIKGIFDLPEENWLYNFAKIALYLLGRKFPFEKEEFEKSKTTNQN